MKAISKSSLANNAMLLKIKNETAEILNNSASIFYLR